MSIMEITPLPWLFIGLNLESPLVQGFMYLFTFDSILEVMVIPCRINLRGEVMIAVALTLLPAKVDDCDC